jgi:hypothetical protein
MAFLARNEIVTKFKNEFLGRDVYKDKELAILLANGQKLSESAKALKMNFELAKAISKTPTFNVLLKRLRKEREELVYGDNPDMMSEAMARDNFWVLQQIRDDPTAEDRDRIRAATTLHEMRPSVRRGKMEENQVRVVFEGSTLERLQEGMKKIDGPTIELEGEFREVVEVNETEEMGGEEEEE